MASPASIRVHGRELPARIRHYVRQANRARGPADRRSDEPHRVRQVSKVTVGGGGFPCICARGNVDRVFKSGTNRTRTMRLAVTALFLGIVSSSWAAEPVTLEASRYACRDPQDLLDYVRSMKRAQLNQDLEMYIVSGFIEKLNDGSCRKFMVGSSTYIGNERNVQGSLLECLQLSQDDSCFYALVNQP